MKPYFLIFGFGYTAKVLAHQLSISSFSIVGTTRSSALTQLQSHSNIKLIDFNHSDIEQHLSRCTHLLISIPPDKSGNDVVLAVYGRLIKENAPKISWVGYLSSTGVYGDYQGAWVNEESLCKPVGQSGFARLTAENAWLRFAKEYHLPLHVFRIAGIYGSKRNALERLLAGKKYSVYKEGHFFSRIHVEDIAKALIASISCPNPFSIYNLADDEPAPGYVVDEYAASLLGLKPLPRLAFDEAIMSHMERDFYASNRRVSNTKIKNELNVVFNYPSFREGLNQIWRDEFTSQG